MRTTPRWLCPDQRSKALFRVYNFSHYAAFAYSIAKFNALVLRVDASPNIALYTRLSPVRLWSSTNVTAFTAPHHVPCADLRSAPGAVARAS